MCVCVCERERERDRETERQRDRERETERERDREKPREMGGPCLIGEALIITRTYAYRGSTVLNYWQFKL